MKEKPVTIKVLTCPACSNEFIPNGMFMTNPPQAVCPKCKWCFPVYAYGNQKFSGG